MSATPDPPIAQSQRGRRAVRPGTRHSCRLVQIQRVTGDYFRFPGYIQLHLPAHLLAVVRSKPPCEQLDERRVDVGWIGQRPVAAVNAEGVFVIRVVRKVKVPRTQEIEHIGHPP